VHGLCFGVAVCGGALVVGNNMNKVHKKIYILKAACFWQKALVGTSHWERTCDTRYARASPFFQMAFGRFLPKGEKKKKPGIKKTAASELARSFTKKTTLDASLFSTDRLPHRMLNAAGQPVVAGRCKNFSRERVRPIPAVQDKFDKGVFRTTPRFAPGRYRSQGTDGNVSGTKTYSKWRQKPPECRIGHTIKGEGIHDATGTNGNIARTSYTQPWGDSLVENAAFKTIEPRVAGTSALVRNTLSHTQLKSTCRELEEPVSSFAQVSDRERERDIWSRGTVRAVSAPALMKNMVSHPQLKSTCRELAEFAGSSVIDSRVTGFAPSQSDRCPSTRKGAPTWRFGQPKKPFTATETPAGTLVHADLAPKYNVYNDPHPSVPRTLTVTSSEEQYPHFRFPNARYSGNGQFPWWKEESYANTIGPGSYDTLHRKDLNQSSNSQFYTQKTAPGGARIRGDVKPSAVFQTVDRVETMQKNMGIFVKEGGGDDADDFIDDGEDDVSKMFVERRREEIRHRQLVGAKLRLKVHDLSPLQMCFEDITLDSLDPTREKTQVSVLG
jgi:hypothetical protein